MTETQPPLPEPQNTQSIYDISTAELEAQAERYHKIMTITGAVGVLTTTYAAIGEFVSEVTRDTYMNAPPAELSYWGAGFVGIVSLGAALGARFSRNGYWEEACSPQSKLDEDRP